MNRLTPLILTFALGLVMTACNDPILPPSPDFILNLTPSSLTIVTGSSNQTTVALERLNGLSAAIDLTLEGSVIGTGANQVKGAFVISTPSSAGLTLTVGSSVAAGTYNLTVRGISGSLNHTIPIALTVTAVIVKPPLGIGRISAGWQHSCGLTSSGVAYCWGNNSSGELGDASTIGTRYPQMVATSLTFSSITTGWLHSCGLTLSGAAYCWGSNISGQLGNGNTTNLVSLVPVAVAAPTGGNFLGFSSISASRYHTCGLALNGTAYCWGYNGYGALGNNSTTSSSVPVIVNAFLTFSSITTGTEHTCGLTLSGATYCWGRNSSGELGNNSTTNSNVPVIVAAPQTFSSVTAGDYHTCALGLNGEAYCWGRNIFGELGNNSTTNSSAPLPVATTLRFSSIMAGGTFSCGLTSSGAAHCWGGYTDGELGNGIFGSSGVPVAVVAPAGGSALTFSSVSAGFAHACGLTALGTAYCWGRNGTGQLGDSSTSNKNVPVAVGNFN